MAEREAAIPRPAWMVLREQVERELAVERERHAFDPSYMSRTENRRAIERNEWQILKELQKEERIAFFAEGKQAYTELGRAIYREVREEFRPEWASYYAAKRDGLDFDTLAEIRAGLIARQKEMLDERREAAAAELRAERDIEYRALLDGQKEQRAELADWQEQGISWRQLLGRAYPGVQDAGRDGVEGADALDRAGSGSRLAEPGELAAGRHGRGKELELDDTPSVEEATFARSADGPSMRPSRDLASGLAGGLLAFLGSISESVTGGHTAPPRKPQVIDPLARYGVLRGPPQPDAAVEKARRDKDEREAWDAWKEKRELDRSRSGW
jgi:hypothetical protein